MAGNKNQQRTKASKEAFYVMVESGEGTVSFFPATDHVGKVMPFRKPRATCAMRVSSDVVAFSLLHLTNKNASVVAAKPVQFPHGPLAKLERKSRSVTLADDEIVVEIHERPARKSVAAQTPTGAGEGTSPTAPASPAPVSDVPEADTDSGDAAVVEFVEQLSNLFGDLLDVMSQGPDVAEVEESGQKPDTGVDTSTVEPAEQLLHRFTIRRDDNNVVTIDGDEHVVELPKGAVQLSVYLRSPVVGRTLAIGFIGHLGKPGNSETVARLAGMVLNSLSHLPDFRILAKLETVSLPAPSRAGKPIRRGGAPDKVRFPVATYLFSTDLQPVCSGNVTVEVDLENANPSSGRLLFHYTPEVAIADAFEHYRTVFDTAVSQGIRVALGDDLITSITYDIVLGGVDLAVVEALQQAGNALTGFDCTPTQFRPHD